MKLVCENENAMPRKITGAAAAPASTTGRRAPNTHRPVIVSSANTSTRPNRLGSNRSELTRNRSEYALAISIFAFSTIVVFANHSQIATPARITASTTWTDGSATMKGLVRAARAVSDASTPSGTNVAAIANTPRSRSNVHSRLTAANTT